MMEGSGSVPPRIRIRETQKLPEHWLLDRGFLVAKLEVEYGYLRTIFRYIS
jgi:hypothetical protein